MRLTRFALFLRFGQLSGHEVKAQQRIDEFTQRLHGLRNAQTGKTVVRTFYPNMARTADYAQWPTYG